MMLSISIIIHTSDEIKSSLTGRSKREFVMDSYSGSGLFCCMRNIFVSCSKYLEHDNYVIRRFFNGLLLCLASKLESFKPDKI